MSCGFIGGVGGKKANSDFLYTARFSFQIVLYFLVKKLGVHVASDVMYTVGFLHSVSILYFFTLMKSP